MPIAPSRRRLRLLTQCGGRGAHPAMVVNEATTVAAQYALAQFSDGYIGRGNSSSVTELVGAATPVRTPLSGPPQLP